MTLSIPSLIKCDHINHLFTAPLCKSQPLWKRIANVAFHVITCCIPFVIYRLVACCSKLVSQQPVLPPKPGSPVLPPKPDSPVLPPKPGSPVLLELSDDDIVAIREGRKPFPEEVSTVASDAISAIKSIVENPDNNIESLKFATLSQEKQSLCPVLSKVSFYRSRCVDALKQALKSSSVEDPLVNDKEVLAAINIMIQAAFTEGMLMIDELRNRKIDSDDAVKQDQDEDSSQQQSFSYAQFLCSKDYYYARIFPVFPRMYNLIRKGPIYDDTSDTVKKASGEKVSVAYINQFKIPETYQYRWSLMFREYRQSILCLTDADHDFEACLRSSWKGMLDIPDEE